MRVIDACSGQESVEIFCSTTLCLERNADQIDSLNVFRVPHVAAEINLVFTMRSTVEEAFRSTDKSASANLEVIHSGQPQYNYIISVE